MEEADMFVSHALLDMQVRRLLARKASLENEGSKKVAVTCSMGGVSASGRSVPSTVQSIPILPNPPTVDHSAELKGTAFPARYLSSSDTCTRLPWEDVRHRKAVEGFPIRHLPPLLCHMLPLFFLVACGLYSYRTGKGEGETKGANFPFKA
jgi:hypothetical protein